MTIGISFSKLFTFSSHDTSVRLPLDMLMQGAGHVHGFLKIEISGRNLPYLGYFGPDDVCFNTWIEELSHAVQTLGTAETATYIFDEGEQGQPAFTFQRDGDFVCVSVTESLLSGATADPSYQNVRCLWLDFNSAVLSFFACFRKALEEQCPQMAQTWWAKHAQ